MRKEEWMGQFVKKNYLINIWNTHSYAHDFSELICSQILQQEVCSMKPEIITTEDVSVEENNQMFSKESEAHIIQAQQTLAPESK